MNAKQRKFWGPYVAAIGSENFVILGMMIKSKFYCGPDMTLAEGAEQFAQGQLENILKRVEIYKELMAQPTLDSADLELIFTSLVQKPFYDVEMAQIIDKQNLDISDEDYWELVMSIWRMQELNTDGNRKKNWKAIFTHRPTIPSLTADLPSTFTAYRAGKEDGYSWTLDKDIALWFQQRFKAQFGKIPFLERTFQKEDAVFYTNARNEQEVVILPK